MIDTHIINIKKTATFYIVGHPEDIDSLLTYTDLHFNGVIDDVPLFMDRLLFQELYCYIKPQSLLCRPLIWIYKRELIKAGRWIDFDSYIAAYYVAYPEYAMKNLPFNLEEVLNVIICDNPWIPLFDVDENEIVSRIKRSSQSK